MTSDAKWGTVWRTLRALEPLQIAARPVRVTASQLIKGIPAGYPPKARPATKPANMALQTFAASERARIEARLPRLPEGSLLRSYEEAYGLELDPSSSTARSEWASPVGVQPYPASVRARR